MAINVYNSALTNQLWYTDKCRIATTTTPVTYQVFATALGNATAGGNIYASNETLGANEIQYVYVGAGNYLTITGSNFTVQEIGTASSAQYGTGNFTTNLVQPSGSAQFTSGQHLDVASNAAFGFGTGDFTLEGWYYHTTGGRFHVLFDFRTTTPQVAMLVAVNTSDKIYLYVNGSVVLTTTASLTLNSWVHVAISKVSGATKLYVNGVQSGPTYTDTNNYVSPAPVSMGADYVGANGYEGYATNMRIVKGVGVYTGNFTVPTAPLSATQSAGTNISAITGTQTSLLLRMPYNNVYFLTDSSTNNFTVANTGPVVSTANNPF